MKEQTNIGTEKETAKLSKNEQLIANLVRPELKQVQEPQDRKTWELTIYGRPYKDDNGDELHHDDGSEVRDKYKAFLKYPNRHIIQKASAMAAKDKTVDAGLFILNSCWVDGNEEMKKEGDGDYLLVGASVQAYQMIEIADGKIKKN